MSGREPVVSNEVEGHAEGTTKVCVKGFSTGGQKSVYECWCTPGELRELTESLRELIVEKEDRVHIFSMDGRSRPHTLGIAVPPSDPEFFYFG